MRTVCISTNLINNTLLRRRNSNYSQRKTTMLLTIPKTKLHQTTSMAIIHIHSEMAMHQISKSMTLMMWTMMQPSATKTAETSLLKAVYIRHTSAVLALAALVLVVRQTLLVTAIWTRHPRCRAAKNLVEPESAGVDFFVERPGLLQHDPARWHQMHRRLILSREYIYYERMRSSSGELGTQKNGVLACRALGRAGFKQTCLLPPSPFPFHLPRHPIDLHVNSEWSGR